MDRQSIRNFLFYQVSEVFIRGSQIIIIPILAYFQKDYLITNISMIYYIGSLVASFFLFGMPVYLIYNKSLYKKIKGPVNSFASFYLIVFGILIFLGIPFAFYIHNLIHQTFANLTVGFLIGGIMLMNYLTLYKFKTLDRGYEYFIFSISLFVGSVILGLGVSMYFDSPVFFYTVYILFFIYFLWKYINRKKFRSSLSGVKDVLKYGYIFAPSAFSGWILANFDKFVLNMYLSDRELSLYIQLSSLLAVTIITIISLDKIYENKFFILVNSNKSPNSIQKKFFILYMVIIGLIITISVFLNFFVLDSHYNLIVILILLGASFPFAANQVIVKHLLFRKKNKTVTKNSFISAIVTMILVLLFAKDFGVVAASLITFIGYTSIFVLNFNSAKKYVFQGF